MYITSITIFLILTSPINSFIVNWGKITPQVATIPASSISTPTKLFSKNNIKNHDPHNKYSDITEIKKSIKLAAFLMRPVYKPRSENQKLYVNYLNDPNVSMVFGVGPAGCGKTLFACIAAITALKNGDISKIILTRPIVSVQEELGFLPGDIATKMDPWLQPLFDIFLENYTKIEMDKMIAEGVIEISPLGFMRGRTFKRTFVICDELQNSTPGQMLMLLTRIGNGCKMVITGDLKQSDLIGKNGLSDFMEKYRDRTKEYDEIRLIEMTVKDVERSLVVKNILEMYNKEPEQQEIIKRLDGVVRPFALYDDDNDSKWLEL